MLQLTIWSAPAFLTLCVCAMAQQRLHRHRNVPGTEAMRYLIAGIAAWSLGQLLFTLVTDLSVRVVISQLQYLGVVSVPACWLVFALTYTRQQRSLSRRALLAIAAPPAVTLVLAWTNELHGWIWRDWYSVTHGSYVGARSDYGPWFYVYAAYAYVTMIGATAILVFVLGQSRRHRRPLYAVLIAASAPILLSVLYLSPWKFSFWIDPTPLGFAIGVIVMYNGVLRYGLLDLTQVARHRVVEQLDDGVVTVNRAGLIVDVNPSACYILGIDRPDMTLSLKSVISARALDELVSRRQSSADVTIDGRAYDVRATSLDAASDNGELVLVLRDVTRSRETERNLRTAQRELERLAHTDPLTGLYNRRFFMDRLREEAERVRRHGSAISVLLFDLDHFKRVNDGHGHDVGDRVLIEVAGVALAVKRITDVVARIGGEEFALLLPETDREGAIHLAQRLKTCIAEINNQDKFGNVFHVTVSIGAATVMRAGRDTDQLMTRADEALYRAKRHGRNMICTDDA